MTFFSSLKDSVANSSQWKAISNVDNWKQLFGYKAVRWSVYVVSSVILARMTKAVFRRVNRKSFKGQVVLITGGGGRNEKSLGRLLANDLAVKHEARVIIWDIDAEGIRTVEDEIRGQGGFCKGYICDITNYQKVSEVAEQVEKEIGMIDVLINNAGIVIGNKFEDLLERHVRKTMDVNCISNFWTCKAFMPHFKKKVEEGKVPQLVTISSCAGIVGTRRLVDYSASKFAVMGFHEALRNEMRFEQKINVDTTLVCPFFIRTGMFPLEKDLPLQSILDPDWVVSQIIDGMQHRDEIIVLPKWMFVAFFCKSLTEPFVIDYFVEKVLRFSDLMDFHTTSNPPLKKLETNVDNPRK